MIPQGAIRVGMFGGLLLLVGEGLGLIPLAGMAGEKKAETTQERFWREAPPAWQKFLQYTKKLQGKHSFHLNIPHIAVNAENEYERKYNDHCQAIYSSKKRVIQGKVDYHTFAWEFLNPQYGFVLTRLQASSPWIAHEIYTDPQQAEKAMKASRQEIDYGFTLPLRLGSRGELLPVLVTQALFQVQRCVPITRQGRLLIAVDFQCPHPVNHFQDNPVQGGVFWLDPERLWCMAGYDVQLKTVKGEAEREVVQVEEWQLVNDEFWFPRRRTFQRLWQEGGLSRKSIIVDKWEVFLPSTLPPDEEFTLSAFGFPEPPLGGGGRPWYVWLAWGGILFLLLGLVCRWLLRRRAAGAG
jgi:hypothetical protein